MCESQFADETNLHLVLSQQQMGFFVLIIETGAPAYRNVSEKLY